MYKYVLLILTLLLLFLTACTKQDTNNTTTNSESEQTTIAEELSVSDYFPFENDIHKSYTGEGNEYAQYQTYVDYQEKGAIQIRNLNPGTESVSVYIIENGMLKKVFFQGETYYRMDFTSLRTMEDILIKEPIQVGNTWTTADGSTRSITSINADVNVPYGTFKALEITTTGNDYIIKDYYVSGIGLVKSEFASNNDASSIITSSLNTFEKGTPINQNIRFYYPDFNSERLLYVERSVELYTGSDINDLFEEQLKQVPQNSGLLPLMSADTSINSINYDNTTGIITVDFSSDFVTSMNAGTTLESMILSSVADTFGNYFQTNKVAITLDGNPYESGHVLFDEGEYLTADWEGVLAY